MATLKKKITSFAEIDNSNVVKVVTNKLDNALLFSRCAIPFDRENTGNITYYKHIGIYGYRRDFLETFVNLPKSQLEEIEKLEQLRVLENNYKIKVLETQYETIGVDMEEHISLVEQKLKEEMIKK